MCIIVFLQIRDRKSSIREAGKQFKINPTFLYRRLHNTHQGVQGRSTALSKADEETLATNIKIMAKWGFPLTKEEIKNVVFHYVTANGLKTVFKNNRPGNDWFVTFCDRHRLSLKKPENLEAVRRKATSDPFIIFEFYDLLQSQIEKLDLQDKPDNIYNLDETYFSFDPSRIKAVGVKGEKFHRNIQGSGRENITVLACVSAGGNLLPPLFVFQANNLWSSWKGNNDLPNTFYACSEKGWMTANIFQDYFYKFCTLVKERPLLLIFDGHLTHLDVGTIEKAKSENITIIKLPAHTTDLLQPLDKCCFRPLKILWDKELISWQTENQRKLTKSEFVDLLCKIWHNGMTSDTIMAGFRSTGIYPPNRNKYPVSRLDPEKLVRYNEKANKEKTSNTVNENVPSSSSQLPQSLMDDCVPISPSFLPNQIPVIGTNEASSSVLLPQTTQSLIDSRIIRNIPAQASTSFESLLLEKVNKHHHPATPTRRKIDGKGKVITSEEFLHEIKTKIEDKKNKAAKKMKTNEQGIEESFTVGTKNTHKNKKKKECRMAEESSEESDNLVEMSDNSDDLDDIDIVPPPEYLDMLSANSLQIDDFVLARFKGGKRSVFTYRYVCSVLNIICESNEIEIMGLKSVSDDKKQFIRVLDDISFITRDEIIGKLPPPEINEEIFLFSAPVDIYEQKLLCINKIK